MTQENKKLTKNVLPFPAASVVKKEKQDEDVPFKQLAEKLEKRIVKMERDLKSSMMLLEEDIHLSLKAKNMEGSEKQAKEEMEHFAKQLEARIQKTLSTLQSASQMSPEEKKSIDGIKNLSSQLTKILSFDFYKGVLSRLTREDGEEEVDPFGMDRRLVAKIKPFLDFLYYKYWRVATTGVENIPDDGRALIVGNHSGTLPYDGAMIRSAIMNEHTVRKDARFLVEDFVYHMPILGTFMYRVGGVRACQENAEYLLNAGHLVIVFPEGVKGIGKYYRNRYRLQRFGRGGFIRLCMKTNSPLIPVGIVGAEEIHPIFMKSHVIAKMIGIPYIPITPTFPLLGLLGMIPLPTKWTIHFGKPITFDRNQDATDDDLYVNKQSERVREHIQEIIFELLRNRRSVFMG